MISILLVIPRVVDKRDIASVWFVVMCGLRSEEGVYVLVLDQRATKLSTSIRDKGAAISLGLYG